MLRSHAVFAVSPWMIVLVCALAVTGFGVQVAQALPPQVVGPDEGSSSPGTNPLSAGLSLMSAGSGTTCVYVENFEEGDGGWTVIDPTEGEVYWNVSTYDAGGASVSIGDQLFKLTAEADAAAQDYFGRSVGISGNKAIVGADGELFFNPPGAAYIFDLTTGARTLKLTAASPSGSDDFGYSVAISGNLAVVGAQLDTNINGHQAGAVYVFDATTGAQIHKLIASDGTADDRLGAFVAISGNWIIAGAQTAGPSQEGAAYIFDASTGVEHHKLTASDGGANHWFGEVVAIDGNTAIVGAPRNNSQGSLSGAAYVFDVTTGAELYKLTASDGASQRQFGCAVGVSGNLAVIGAKDGGAVTGFAYVFDASTGTELHKLTPSDGVTGDNFGRAAAISGNLIVVGSNHDDGGGPGSAYLFDAATGTELSKLIATDPSASNFGLEVSVDGDRAIVGALSKTVNGLSIAGAAYVFAGADEGATPLGVWWCGSNSPCFAAPPGYGTNWIQRLDKTFVLPASGPIDLDFTHQYDTESGWDFCHVQITTDGGATYSTLASYTGSSGGFLADTVDLSAYAGATAGIRFLFTSDGGWDDQDGNIDTDGAWRLDEVTVTGFPTDDFETGGDGWTASTTPPLDIAQFRLETDPPCPDPANCENYCTSWVAFDETGVFPYTPPDLVAAGQGIGTGIESPEIPIPADAGGMIMEFDIFGNDMPFLDMVLYYFQVISTGTAGCEQTSYDNTLYYTGVNPITFTFKKDITPYFAPGATSFRVRLILRDFQWQYPYYPWSGVHGGGVYFDNVAFLALGTADPGIECPRTCGPQEPSSVTVSGTVSSDCDGPLLGVTVDLDTEGDFQTTSTDSAGTYSFTTLAVGTTGEASIVVPLGYEAVTPADGHVAVTLDQDRTVDFTLSCLDPQGEARSMGYWKHQANVFLKNKGNAQESQDDMETDYPNAVFNHFYENGLNAIEVEGVTYMDDGGTPVPLDLAAIAATLSVHGNAGMEAKAKQQYLAFLLNIASGKLLTTSVVSDDEATASQALQHVADMINDGDPANDETAKDICDTINNAQMVGAGVIDLGYTTIAYSRDIGTSRFVTVLRGPSPNPILSSATIRFQLKEPGEARIRIYDLSGRLVRSVFNQWAPAGPHEVTWDGSSDQGARVASGIYYIRMDTRDYGATKRAVLLR